MITIFHALGFAAVVVGLALGGELGSRLGGWPGAIGGALLGGAAAFFLSRAAWLITWRRTQTSSSVSRRK